ncbi:LacI family DNA-binding transcriptional regulator [Geminicoccus roseus]|uniref:LacI family DNA-binding transcriptional regulator n=1 Tax=Geminicoccus roseus TaxID=404900 RepID=UPI00041AB443|nr:LacI family DNA-binding transcriptional regulator [Geminicoccus roseus]
MNWRRRPTMEDVAKAAGVSKATVSRVLAGIEGGWTPATAEKVRRAAIELGYVVNSLAASLRSRQSFTIGLVVADVSNPFFGGIASGVESRLSQTGYSVILGNSGNSLEREKALVKVLVEKQIDGLITATSAAAADHLREAQDRGVRVVLVDSEVPGLDADSVTIDNRAMAEMAVRHLLELGHRRIAIVTGPMEATFDRQRLAGYAQALAAQGLAFDEQLVLRGDLLAHGGEQAADRFLRLQDRPTAIFATNNMMTLGVLVALTRAGIQVPGEVSLVGFDDQEWYPVCHPPLTAIANPACELGHAAADRLLTRLTAKGDGAQPQAERLVLPARLVLRASTAAGPTSGIGQVPAMHLA